MRNFRLRVSLAAAVGIAAASLTGVSAQAETRAHAVSRYGAVWAAPAGVWTPLGGDPPAPGAVCGVPFINEDPRLGPINLPKKGALGAILRSYVPLGGLRPQKFLDRYWDYATSSYRYPPDSGFAHSGGYSNGRTLIAPMTLLVGEKVDRFGSENGSFLAPLGTPYADRALPGINLDTFPNTPQYICNYHAYRVSREFAVDFGPIAPAFQQPGGGDQYHLVSRLIPEAPQASPEVSVRWLLDHGYLESLN